MDKLEKHIKNTLGNREISPSPEAWNKIAGELKTGNTTSTKKTYWWAIAATLAVLVVLSLALFKGQSPAETNPGIEVVRTNKKEKESILIQEENAIVIEDSKTLEEIIPGVSTDEEKPLMEDEIFENPVEVVQTEVSKEQEPLKDIKEVSDLAINNKLEEVLAQVNTMENNAITVSDAEIDSMLIAAQRELLTAKALNESGKVDAMALLNEVELELYDDERNPLFIRLKEGFFKLRTAVADRNN